MQLMRIESLGLTQKVIVQDDNTKQKTQARACIQKYITEAVAKVIEKHFCSRCSHEQWRLL